MDDNDVMTDEKFLDLLCPEELKVGDMVNIIVYDDSILETKKVTHVDKEEDIIFVDGYNHAFSYKTRKWDLGDRIEIRKA